MEFRAGKKNNTMLAEVPIGDMYRILKGKSVLSKYVRQPDSCLIKYPF
jgi:hypothetical protein